MLLSMHIAIAKASLLTLKKKCLVWKYNGLKNIFFIASLLIFCFILKFKIECTLQDPRATCRHSNTGNYNDMKKKKIKHWNRLSKDVIKSLSEFSVCQIIWLKVQRLWVSVWTRWCLEFFSKLNSYIILWNDQMKEVGTDGLVRK